MRHRPFESFWGGVRGACFFAKTSSPITLYLPLPPRLLFPLPAILRKITFDWPAAVRILKTGGTAECILLPILILGTAFRTIGYGRRLLMLTTKEAIEKRRSIRKFKPDAIPDEYINELLRRCEIGAHQL